MSAAWWIAGLVWREVLRRKDAYVLFILLAAFLGTLLSLDAFGLQSQTGYVKEIGLLLTWGFAWILAVTVSVRQLPQEEEQGTIFALLAKPVTRGQVIAGKWLGAWSVVAFAAAVFYVFLAGIVVARGGAFGAAVFFQALSLHLILLGIITALGVMFSARLHNDAAVALTLVVTLAAHFALPRVPGLVLGEPGLRRAGLLAMYYALPHLELFDLRRRLAHGYDPVAAATWIQVAAYGALLTALWLLLAWLAYRGKRLARGGSAS